jgi:ADP-heptose:LPS heptosyltransferase
MPTLPDFRSLQSLLILKPSSLGDIVHTLPAVHAIKSAFPQLKIDWLAHPNWAPVLEGNPDIRDVIAFPRDEFRGWAGWRRYRKWMAAFRKRPAPDVALDFQGLLRTAWLARRSRAKVVAGMTDSREGARFFHHVRIAVNSTEHAVDRYLRLARACGAQGPVEFPLPDGRPPAACPEVAKSPGFLLLHPFSRGKGKSLTWEQVRIFLQRVSPIPVLVCGRLSGGTDQPTDLPPNAQVLINRTSLLELIWLMRRSRFTVSVDSGPMHIAAALGPNVLSIHTWSDPRLVGPYPLEAWIWKAGTILRRRDADAALCTRSQAFADADAATLADFALTQFS